MIQLYNNWLGFLAQKFYGHTVFWLVEDFKLAFEGLLFVIITAWLIRKRWWLPAVITGYFALLYFPNSAYLILEVRHLILIDGIADTLSFAPIVVFSAISLCGVILAVVTNLAAINLIPHLKKHFDAAALILSFLAAFGATLGLNALQSINGLRNPVTIIQTSMVMLSSVWWVLFIVTFTSFLYFTTLIGEKILHRYTKFR